MRLIPLINAVKLNAMNEARCLNDSFKPANRFMPLLNEVKSFE